MKKLIDKIMAEVKRATELHPDWPTDPLHAKAIINEESGEVDKAILQTIYEPTKADKTDVEEEAIQTAAMWIRFLMSLDKYEYTESWQHEQGQIK